MAALTAATIDVGSLIVGLVTTDRDLAVARVALIRKEWWCAIAVIAVGLSLGGLALVAAFVA